MDQPDDAYTDVQILGMLSEYSDKGVLDYVLTTEPLGEQWVIGVRGDMLKFTDKNQVVAFLAGLAAMAHWSLEQAMQERSARDHVLERMFRQ